MNAKVFMAPEILMHKLNATSPLSSFQKADMYSVSLVIWEIMRRCECVNDDRNETNIKANKCMLPYSEYLNSDEIWRASEIEYASCLRRVICESKLRPTIKSEWRLNGVLNDLCQIIEELWAEEPNERFSSFRLCKTLNKIQNKYHLNEITKQC